MILKNKERNFILIFILMDDHFMFIHFLEYIVSGRYFINVFKFQWFLLQTCFLNYAVDYYHIIP